MARSPIEMMLDGATWRPLPPIEKTGEDIPHATHEGVLKIGDETLRCYQLSNGQRVFAEEDVCRFFGVDSMDGLMAPLR